MQHEQLQKLHDESLAEIFAANDDFADRLATLSVNVYLDREDDTFVLTVGDPQEAITESIDNSVYLRVDPDTLKIVGFEILDVTPRMATSKAIRNLVRDALPFAGKFTDKPEPVMQTLRELVTA